jgi:hypothetical protein
MGLAADSVKTLIRLHEPITSGIAFNDASLYGDKAAGIIPRRCWSQ